MKVSQLFNEKKAVYSFEIFPPKPTSSIESIEKTLDGIADLSPDYVSITCGAGGSAVMGNATFNLAKRLKDEYKILPLVHVTAIHSDKAEIENYLEELDKADMHSILALRGDINPDRKLSDTFRHASDLVTLLKKDGRFDISAACCPEGHPESVSLKADLDWLKFKVDQGVTHLNSQMCFSNDNFYDFLDRVRKAGINIPIQVGIMPIVKTVQIERTMALAGVEYPAHFSKMIYKHSNNPEALAAAGIAYATEQIIDLLSSGVDGIHLYMMNNVETARKITENVKSVIKNINENDA